MLNQTAQFAVSALKPSKFILVLTFACSISDFDALQILRAKKSTFVENTFDPSEELQSNRNKSATPVAKDHSIAFDHETLLDALRNEPAEKHFPNCRSRSQCSRSRLYQTVSGPKPPLATFEQQLF